MTLQIQAGRFYRTRDGRRVGPMRHEPGWSGPWRSEGWAGGGWTDAGRVGDREASWPCDGSEIIVEWPDEPALVTRETAPIAPRVGDEIEVRLKIIDVQAEDVMVVSLRDRNGIPRDIGFTNVFPGVRHIPAARPIEVGDRVQLSRHSGCVFQVLGISGEEAWIKNLKGGETRVEDVSDLTRVDGEVV